MSLNPLTNTSENIVYFAGERILKKGETADKAYMILSGKVRVYLKNNEKVVDLATLAEGEIFGETAIFDGGEYGANVDALEETELLVITPQSLKDMMKSCDPVLSALVKMLTNRLNQTNKKLLESETRDFIDIAFV
ncbi:MAG: Crp/Fnr family transcriptional regulator [Alphaproteobacteria bacterium]